MNFGADVQVGGLRVGFDDAAVQRGWLYRHGEFVSLRELTFTTRLAADGVSQAHVTLLARDTTGQTHPITGEVLRCVPLVARGHEHMLTPDGLTRWHYQGLSAYGICEYAHQTDAARRPVVPIDSARAGLSRPHGIAATGRTGRRLKLLRGGERLGLLQQRLHQGHGERESLQARAGQPA